MYKQQLQVITNSVGDRWNCLSKLCFIQIIGLFYSEQQINCVVWTFHSDGLYYRCIWGTTVAGVYVKDGQQVGHIISGQKLVNGWDS